MALCHVEDVFSKSSLQQYTEIPLKKVRFLTIPLGKTGHNTGIPRKKKNVYRIFRVYNDINGIEIC